MSKQRLVTKAEDIRRMLEMGDVSAHSYMRFIQHSSHILMYIDGSSKRGERCYIQDGAIKSISENRIGPNINLRNVGGGIDSDIAFDNICEVEGYDQVVAYDIHYVY